MPKPTDIGSILKGASNDRAFGVFDAEAGILTDPASTTTYAEMAWMGTMFPKDPGSATWMFKNLAGITPDGLSSTQSTDARNKNVNVYEVFHDQPMVWEGKMANGEFIDIIRGADWLEARLEERIFFLLLNTDKVPFTDAGATLLENEIRAQLLEAVTVGYITNDFIIAVPKVADVSQNDKANRVFPAIKFTAILQGAIHSVTVQGVVTV